MKTTFCDWTFGINHQALAVAHMLDGTFNFPKDVYAEMSPWYNGREKGIVWVVGKITGKKLCIAVFEHRNSDSICVLKWERDTFGLNPPTIESDGKLAYPTDNKHNDIAYSVSYGEILPMVEWIREEVLAFVNEE